MTIAGAFAGYDARDAPVLGVFADSRVTLGSDQSDDAHKVLKLAPRACCTASGNPIPVLNTLENVVRSLASDDKTRQRRGKPRLSLWHQAGVLFHEIGSYRKVHAITSTINVVVAGYLGTRSPALAQATFAKDMELRFLFKPRKGQIVCRTTGQQVARELASEAARFSIARQDRFAALLGVLREMSRDDQRFEAIGGDVSLAVAYGGIFMFPAIEFSNANALFEQLDEENLFVPKFTGGLPRASKVDMSGLRAGVEDLFYGEEPPWVRNDARPVPHYLGVVGHPGVFLDHVVEDGLHPREVASTKQHAGGPPVEEPPRASAADLPTASDELTIISWTNAATGERMRYSISLGANGGFR